MPPAEFYGSIPSIYSKYSSLHIRMLTALNVLASNRANYMKAAIFVSMSLKPPQCSLSVAKLIDLGISS